ncbi:thermonuclease family protein [Epilithonimonas hungarica]|uniref:Endonuclease YncB, thermonuclease family n=1 Tax=Epilithonimonas hungarica TaxID=454006 RepID=A0A1G7U9N1_9FLAO|nr:thermonuclease family protein [Epilithonimonas hungarica]MDP9955361.1 endonuclease YncB(thermonuclease family) [Epilithonimonas hungarica]SDG44098.1 Endonuclease YncB, thermonuclease family [Epilithonimonas hungarica]
MNRFLLLILFSIFSFGQNQLKENLGHKTFSAKVIGITDGDTMEILYKKMPIKIRLAHIDSPEKRGTQPFGNNAKKALSDLCFGKMVTIKAEKYDRYKRLIAVVINDKGQNVNKQMLKLGMAWHYVKYSKDADYAKLENEARKNRVGLWQDKNPIAPWLWREKKKK